ncbi:MAG TPA: HAD family hydrolase [Pseudolabrys sp.]|nr:HAD family hydrolase [Pseudolabrys sp.]
MAPPATIVFDLDGTLVDTAPDLIDTLNVVFAREGLPPVPFDTGRNLIGGGIKAMIVRGLEAERRAAGPAEIERMFADFVAHYSDHIADRSRAFAGLEPALDLLARRQFRLAVCTNKLERLSLKLLGALNLAERFAAICGHDTFGVQKPEPAILLRTIAAAGGDPRRSIMIGDSLTDIRTARAAQIPIVAVDFGYSEPPVAEFGPDRTISAYEQLPGAIAELIAASA